MSARALPVSVRPGVLTPRGLEKLEPTIPQLRRAEDVLARAGDGGLTVWYGAPGHGKSSAAWLLCQLASEREGARAAYLDAPRPSGITWDERKTLRAMLGDLGAPVPDRAVRGRSSNELVRFVATRLLGAGIRILVVDEAGFLGQAGLEAVGMLSDHLAREAEPFHIVLAGMMDLPALLRTSPRVHARVIAHVHFGPVSAETLGVVVLSHHPWITSVCEEGVTVANLMERAHALTNGCMREAIGLFGHVRTDCCTADIRLNPAVLSYAQREREEARARLVREEVRQVAAREALPELMPPELLRRFRNAGAFEA